VFCSPAPTGPCPAQSINHMNIKVKKDYFESRSMRVMLLAAPRGDGLRFPRWPRHLIYCSSLHNRTLANTFGKVCLYSCKCTGVNVFEFTTCNFHAPHLLAPMVMLFCRSSSIYSSSNSAIANSYQKRNPREPCAMESIDVIYCCSYIAMYVYTDRVHQCDILQCT
jgi:hypothetical protein